MTIDGLRFGPLKELANAGRALKQAGCRALRKALPDNKDKKEIFISHVTDEYSVARLLKTHIQAAFGGDTLVFVSSDYTSISGGEEWYATIVDAIKRSKVVVVLLSNQSVNQPWIHFEAGVGLGASCKVIPFVIDNLAPGLVARTLSPLQARSLNDSDDAFGLFQDLAKMVGADDPPSVDTARLAKEIEMLLQKDIPFYF